MRETSLPTTQPAGAHCSLTSQSLSAPHGASGKRAKPCQVTPPSKDSQVFRVCGESAKARMPTAATTACSSGAFDPDKRRPCSSVTINERPRRSLNTTASEPSSAAANDSTRTDDCARSQYWSSSSESARTKSRSCASKFAPPSRETKVASAPVFERRPTAYARRPFSEKVKPSALSANVGVAAAKSSNLARGCAASTLRRLLLCGWSSVASRRKKMPPVAQPAVGEPHSPLASNTPE